jgi:hypothetical protein
VAGWLAGGDPFLIFESRAMSQEDTSGQTSTASKGKQTEDHIVAHENSSSDSVPSAVESRLL